MARDIFQVYTDNPSTTLDTTDLVYIGKNPFGVSNDSAILASDFLEATLQPTNNLSDLSSEDISRNNLGVDHAHDFWVTNSDWVLDNPCPTIVTVATTVAINILMPLMNVTTPGSKSLTLGAIFTCVNRGSANITLCYQDGTPISSGTAVIKPNSYGWMINRDNGTAQGLWDFVPEYQTTDSPIFDTVYLNSVVDGGTYNASDGDFLILKQTSSGVPSVTLPASPQPNQHYIIKDKDGNASAINITINGNGKNIDGSATRLITTNYGSVEIIFNSAEDAWFIV